MTAPWRPLRIVVLGGYGVFGRLAATMLVRDGHRVWVAGRDAAKARACATAIGAEALHVDFLAEPERVFAPAPDMVVDAAGPFQDYGADPYRLARMAIARGADWLDLADDAAFAEGIAALDAEARAAGRRAISGASSVPGLSSAVVAALAEGLDEVLAIDTAILPGNRAPRGRSVMASILGQIGWPHRVWRGGRWRAASGWSDRRLYRLAPGLWRAAYALEVPDVRLFPAHFGARSVTFRAGLELPVMNWGLRLIALLRRLGLPLGPRLAGPLRWIAQGLRPFGSDRGGMVVEVAGTRAGQPVRRRWTLVAEAGAGPFVTGIVVRALARRLDAVAPGARPCLAEAELAEIEACLDDLAVTTARTEEPAPTLFQRALGADWQKLPAPQRRLHLVQDQESFSGCARVERGTGPIARLAAWFFGFPPAAADIPVTVTKTRTDRGEVWERDFAGRVFRSACTAAGPGRFRERFWWFTYEMDLPVADGTMRLPVRRGWVLGVPLPRPLLATSASREYTADGRFHFDIGLGAPLGGGLIVRYRGWLEPDADRPEATRARDAA